jgi:hypothetical protein
MIFSGENSCDACALRTAWFVARVTLPFLISIFSNREQ